MSVQQKKDYIAPQLKVAEFRVERGFSTSYSSSLIQDLDSHWRIEMESSNGESQVQQYQEDSHFNWGF